MSNQSLTCFGTGDGWPSPDRNHASFLYRFGRTSLLLDCGESLDRSYKASGLSYDAPDGIFLSHLHADHFGGFFMFVQGSWLEGRRRDLPVYLPAGGLRPLRAMLDAAFMYEELLPFRLQLAPLSERKTIRVNQVRVTAFCTTHLEGFRRRFARTHRGADFNAYCFLMESGKVRVGHSADLGKPEDLEPLLAKPLDLLVCELAHFSPERIFEYLRGRKLKRVVFVHLARPFQERFARTRRLAAKMLGGIPHSFARDLDEIRF